MAQSARTVLIVEDDNASLLALKLRLEFHGWRPMTADSGASGLAAAREAQPDVILLDLGLPDVGGIDTIRLFTRDADLTGIPVVVLSGNPTATHEEPVLEAGAVAYLEKPADISEVLAAIDGARSLA